MTAVRTHPGRWARRAALVATAAGVVLAATASSAVAADTTDGFNPGPNRIVDTREDFPDRPAGPVVGFFQAQLPDSVADGQTALLSVTVVDPTTSGYVTVYPDSESAPATSDVNFIAGPTVAQAVLVQAAPGASGKIDFVVGGTTTPQNIVVDVVGAFPAASYSPLVPAQRVFDSRTPPVGTPKAGPLSSGVYPVTLPTGEGGVPDDATAVAITLTQVNSSGNGYVSALSTTDASVTSSLNYVAGSIRSNLVIVKPVDGKIYLNLQGSPTDLIVDVKGYSVSTNVAAIAPERVLDSRTAADGGLLGPMTTVPITLPTDAPAGASFALLNVTSTESTVGGYLASYQAPAGEMQTSNLNWAAGQTVAGFVLAPIVDGKAQVYIGVGVTKLVADVEGYVTNAGTTG